VANAEYGQYAAGQDAQNPRIWPFDPANPLLNGTLLTMGDRSGSMAERTLPPFCTAAGL
jgi:hypothetical protein